MEKKLWEKSQSYRKGNKQLTNQDTAEVIRETRMIVNKLYLDSILQKGGPIINKPHASGIF